MSWMFLLIAGVMEVGWPLGFKLSQGSRLSWAWIAFSVASMAASGFFLYLAQRDIPMGTAYAVWTGIGTVGTFVLGILFFRDPATVIRLLSGGLIVIGIVGLKLAHA